MTWLQSRPGSKITGLVDGEGGTNTLDYQRVGLSAAKEKSIMAGQTVNIGGALYTGLELHRQHRSVPSRHSLQTRRTARSLDPRQRLDHAGGQSCHSSVDRPRGLRGQRQRRSGATDANGLPASPRPASTMPCRPRRSSASIFKCARGWACLDMSGLNAMAAMFDSDSGHQPTPEQFEAMTTAPAYPTPRAAHTGRCPRCRVMRLGAVSSTATLYSSARARRRIRRKANSRRLE